MVWYYMVIGVGERVWDGMGWRLAWHFRCDFGWDLELWDGIVTSGWVDGAKWYGLKMACEVGEMGWHGMGWGLRVGRDYCIIVGGMEPYGTVLSVNGMGLITWGSDRPRFDIASDDMGWGLGCDGTGLGWVGLAT